MKNAFISMRSPFPVDHRIIYWWPVLQWPSFDEDQNSIGPELARAVNHILELHPNSRGLVHSISYPRTKLLLDHCRSPRLFTHGNKEGAFDEAITRLATMPGAVLVSPRATEGIDLKGDHSDFQVFIKIPFRMLGDPRTKRRQITMRGWYHLMAAMAIVQGSGRSVRTMTDIAPTYILDVKWAHWYPDHQGFFPGYFQDAVRRFYPTQAL